MKKIITGKKITIEKLAMMVQEGFAWMHENMVTKEDLLGSEKRAEEQFASKKDIQHLCFELREDILDAEERMSMKNGKRIDRLEDDMGVVKNKLKLA